MHKTALFFFFVFFFFGIYNMLAKQIMQLGGIIWKLLPPTGGAKRGFKVKVNEGFRVFHAFLCLYYLHLDV